jgi:hypothetical protein
MSDGRVNVDDAAKVDGAARDRWATGATMQRLSLKR